MNKVRKNEKLKKMWKYLVKIRLSYEYYKNFILNCKLFILYLFFVKLIFWKLKKCIIIKGKSKEKLW